MAAASLEQKEFAFDLYRCLEPSEPPKFFDFTDPGNCMTLNRAVLERGEIWRLYTMTGPQSKIVKIFDPTSTLLISGREVKPALDLFYDIYSGNVEPFEAEALGEEISPFLSEMGMAKELSRGCQNIGEALEDLTGVDWGNSTQFLDLLDQSERLEAELDAPVLLASHLGTKPYKDIRPSHIECSYFGVFGPRRESENPRVIMLSFNTPNQKWFAYYLQPSYEEALLKKREKTTSVCKPSADGRILQSYAEKQRLGQEQEEEAEMKSDLFPPLPYDDYDDDYDDDDDCCESDWEDCCEEREVRGCTCECFVCLSGKKNFKKNFSPFGPQQRARQSMTTPEFLIALDLDSSENRAIFARAAAKSIISVDLEAMTNYTAEVLPFQNISRFKGNTGPVAYQKPCLMGIGWDFEGENFSYKVLDAKEGERAMTGSFISLLKSIQEEMVEKKMRLLQPFFSLLEEHREAHNDYYKSRGMDKETTVKSFNKEVQGQFEKHLMRLCRDVTVLCHNGLVAGHTERTKTYSILFSVRSTIFYCCTNLWRWSSR